MKVDVNINDHTSGTINHKSNIEEDQNLLNRFKCAANEITLMDTSHKNEIFQ